MARFEADRGAVQRLWRVEGAKERRERMTQCMRGWLDELAKVDFDALEQGGKVDWILLAREARQELSALELQEQRWKEMAELVPFVQRIAALAEGRRTFQGTAAEKAAAEVDALAKEIAAVRAKVEEMPDRWPKSVGLRASEAVRSLRGDLDEWYRFGKGYDPLFGWWLDQPWRAASDALDGYARVLREKVAKLGGDDDKTIVGDPIGREALVRDLAMAFIAYTPEELVQIAEREFAWCEARMKEASLAMGFGDDWKKALEKVKQDHVAPGAQPALIRDLSNESIAFLESRELLTIPAFAKESWRMEMMTPERQLVSPFFTGGEVISVSFPTDGMTHEQKLMSLRGNNVHFSRATVHHELIPGHHLQQFMTSRYSTWRRTFSTPFWTEGWALYWETRLWDLGFAKTPEDQVGMLFWRMHRCARIRFSLGFHLGQLTPQQCIDMLVNEVGHERDNAEAEVRRSFNGGYEPLYQCAYMLGALQLRALQKELVGGGKRTEREFHDAVMTSGNMPIEMVRALLAKVPLMREFVPSWRFYPL
ncbi:MAG: DUF885 family protein [Planctomycetes bacterium]|nr:DUF885 family protein [Planctomycetota bacterium]